MNPYSNCFMLEEAIKERLCSKVSITAETFSRLISYTGYDSPEEMRKYLLDQNTSESATVLELILFPDEGFQAFIEEMIEACNPGKKEEEMICNRLINLELKAFLYFPGSAGFLVPIPDETILSFVSRLNICRKTDSRITEALFIFTDDPLKTRCKVSIRTSRWIQNEKNILFLLKIIEKMSSEKNNFLEYLSAALEFMTNPHPESDTLQALESERQRLIHILDASERQDHYTKNMPMEVMMLQGYRRISFERESFIRKINLFNTISKELL